MYYFLHQILADKKDGEIFTLFSGWHFLYIILTFVAIVTVLLCLKNKNEQRKKKVCKYLACIAFGIYIADFFLMPLAYGEIDIEKLPFHACTAMCVMCFFSYHSKCLEKYRTSFFSLGLISNLVYLIYPAGVMWHAVHPLSYRVVQTLIFHSIMTVLCLISLIYGYEKLNIRVILKDLTVTACMTLWAIIGNYVYNGSADGYSHFFNWFFVIRDPFYIIPEIIAPFIMPLLNISIFFMAQTLMRLILTILKNHNNA